MGCADLDLSPVSSCARVSLGSGYPNVCSLVLITEVPQPPQGTATVLFQKTEVAVCLSISDHFLIINHHQIFLTVTIHFPPAISHTWTPVNTQSKHS